jgi:hypothetical protein
MSHARACGRCGGLLRSEYIRRGRLELLACLACGDRTDETILANRSCMAGQEEHSWKTSLWERIRLLASGEWRVASDAHLSLSAVRRDLSAR